MRLLVQRVRSARVEVAGQVVGTIGVGLLVLAGFEAQDGQADINWLSTKLSKLRIFDDDTGAMNRSIVDVGGEVLAVSQL